MSTANLPDSTREFTQSQALLRSILNSTYYAIASYQAVLDDNGHIDDFLITYTNAEVPRNFGLSPEEVIGKTCREVYPGIFENGIFEKLVECIETGAPQRY